MPSGADPSSSLGRTASRSVKSSPSVCKMSKTWTTRKPRICCTLFSSPLSVSIFVLYLQGTKIAMPFSPFLTKQSDFHRLKPRHYGGVGSLQEDHQVIVEAVALEPRHDLQHPLPVVARDDLGDGILELVVGSTDLVVPRVVLGHRVPPWLGGFPAARASVTRRGQGCKSRRDASARERP